MLFDVGMGKGDLAGYVKTLTKLPVAVAITHGHGDHFGQVFPAAGELDALFLYPFLDADGTDHGIGSRSGQVAAGTEAREAAEGVVADDSPARLADGLAEMLGMGIGHIHDDLYRSGQRKGRLLGMMGGTVSVLRMRNIMRIMRGMDIMVVIGGMRARSGGFPLDAKPSQKALDRGFVGRCRPRWKSCIARR